MFVESSFKKSMNSEKLYYTDGHDVMVTATFLKVHNKIYRLAGIIRHNLRSLSPPRAPGLIVLTFGLIIGVAGLFRLIPNGFIHSAQILGKWLTVNDYALIVSGLLLVTGLITLIVMKKRYAVHICTATDEEDIIVSKERAYIAQIVLGLDRALGEGPVEAEIL
jgi:hypothetical protein